MILNVELILDANSLNESQESSTKFCSESKPDSPARNAAFLRESNGS
jgi:hypothetical protein